MLSRNIVCFAAAGLLLAATYFVGFNLAVRLDADAAQSRYETLRDAGRPRAAASYGGRIVALRRKSGETDEALAPILADYGRVLVDAGKQQAAAETLTAALSTSWGRALDPLEQASLEATLARAHIIAGDVGRGVSIYAEFLRLSGDHGAGAHAHDRYMVGGETRENGKSRFYAEAISDAEDLFAETLTPLGDPEKFHGGREEKLIAASNMMDLGAFYASGEQGSYAAAGLLASAYELRRAVLGEDHQDTVQVAMMLGPVYRRLGRLKDAEKIYLDAFHAQEKVKGSNNPDLSLYIRLLAGVYEEQGRATEAQALYVHMRDLFRDAFGEQRYAANRARDRSLDIDRPVSQQFLLPANYLPGDLIAASDFTVPLSKNSGIDEMKLRLAADPRGNQREDNLPARLAQLISLCRSDTGERLSLRSGYRSYETQRDLFQRIGHQGTVTPPGMSEHQTGLAADIDVNGRLMRQSDKAYRCFEENAFRYGFILSYPQGNDYLPGENSFEPWHWRYVGVGTAQLYREAGPFNRPQEFLSALKCYEERAAAGAFAIAGEPDICLDGPGGAGAKVAQKDANEAERPRGPLDAMAKAARKITGSSDARPGESRP